MPYHLRDHIYVAQFRDKLILFDYVIPSEEKLRKLDNIVNKTRLFYPMRTKCLVWAMTYASIALLSFCSSCRVECDEKVVMDSQGVREGAIILNEPFRKLKE